MCKGGKSIQNLCLQWYCINTYSINLNMKRLLYCSEVKKMHYLSVNRLLHSGKSGERNVCSITMTLARPSTRGALTCQMMHLYWEKKTSSLPHVLVGDTAFLLKRHLLWSYPGKHLSKQKRVFNYCLSLTWRMVECTFGILASQWKLYHRVLGVSSKVAVAVVKATYILHNFICFASADVEGGSCAPLPLVPQYDIQLIQWLGSNNASRDALEIRQRYTTYFSSPAGEVEWKHSVI